MQLEHLRMSAFPTEMVSAVAECLLRKQISCKKNQKLDSTKATLSDTTHSQGLSQHEEVRQQVQRKSALLGTLQTIKNLPDDGG